MLNKNVENIDFILLNFEKTVDVMGEIDFVGLDLPPQYHVAVYKRDSLVQRCTVNAPSRIFFFDGLPVDNTVNSCLFYINRVCYIEVTCRMLTELKHSMRFVGIFRSFRE